MDSRDDLPGPAITYTIAIVFAVIVVGGFLLLLYLISH